LLSVNLAAEDQNILCSIGGRYTGKEFDKISLFKEIGIYKAKSINTLMIRGTAMNAECNLVKREEIGDHVMFIEVLEISADEKIKPLVYYNGKYWRLDDK
jgi:flavin reductase (DIM6/NTAB) family NADH-FMN oxidoreductase RutF